MGIHIICCFFQSTQSFRTVDTVHITNSVTPFFACVPLCPRARNSVMSWQYSLAVFNCVQAYREVTVWFPLFVKVILTKNNGVCTCMCVSFVHVCVFHVLCMCCMCMCTVCVHVLMCVIYSLSKYVQVCLLYNSKYKSVRQVNTVKPDLKATSK